MRFPLSAGQVRDRQFRNVRRGVDPIEVRLYLHRVANELAAARAELAASREENVRIKDALRDWQSSVRASGAGMTDSTKRRYLVHVTVAAEDLITARRLAAALGRAVSFLTDVSPGETTVTEEGDQDVHHRVFCDRLLANGRRCTLRAEHDGDCPPRIAR